MVNRAYDVGAMVRVYFDSSEKVPNIAAKKFDGMVTRINRRFDYGAYGVLFELEDAVSDKGMPYVFTTNDLVLV